MFDCLGTSIDNPFFAGYAQECDRERELANVARELHKYKEGLTEESVEEIIYRVAARLSMNPDDVREFLLGSN